LYVFGHLFHLFEVLVCNYPVSEHFSGLARPFCCALFGGGADRAYSMANEHGLDNHRSARQIHNPISRLAVQDGLQVAAGVERSLVLVRFWILAPLFIAARLFILVEVIRSLAYQPPGSYRTT